MRTVPCGGKVLGTGLQGGGQSEAKIRRARWSPERPGGELEAKPALTVLLERESLMRKFSNKKIAAVAVAAVAMTGTGVAYAYWTTTGAGDGEAVAGEDASTDAIQLSQVGTITGLYPTANGSNKANIVVKAVNPASFAQKVGEVTVSLNYPTGCGAANWSLVNADDAFGQLAPGAENTLTVGTIELVETNSNQDTCKEAVLDFDFASAAGE